MYDLGSMSPSDLTECGNALRGLGSGAKSMEEAANNIVRYLYENLGDKRSGEKGCALVRFYKTHNYGDLDAGLQGFADGIMGTTSASPDVKCLTLLATVGDQPDWNSRAKSNGHKAIPLPSEGAVESIPMVSQLVKQFGLEVSAVVKPDPNVIGDLEQRAFNTFHIPEAPGSPYIPAQDEFVTPFGIQSALGLGGMLSSGDIFAIIMFSKIGISRETADSFRELAPSVKEAVEPFVGTSVFA
ncbi:MAG: hypothetical protein ACE5KI_07655 [Dehalococcoidia bacterium]